MMSRKKRIRMPRVTTIIGEGTTIKGDILFTGGLHIDGCVQGDIVAEPDRESGLIVSGSGRVEGEIRVHIVVLNGEVVGDVYASRAVELAAEACVNGNVYYNMLEMALGASVNGHLVHTEEVQRRLEHEQLSAGGEKAAELPVRKGGDNS